MNDRTAAKRTAAPRRSKHFLRGVAAALIVLSHCAPAWSGSGLPPDETYLHDLHIRLARIETLLENKLLYPYRNNTDDPALRILLSLNRIEILLQSRLQQCQRQ